MVVLPFLSSAQTFAQAILGSNLLPAANIISSATDAWRPVPTLAASIGDTAPVLPNIYDPTSSNAQTTCPGYFASNIIHDQHGLSATLSLAGPACNAYGTDIEDLMLSVQYQSNKRLLVNIVPTYLSSVNITQYHVAPERVSVAGIEVGPATTSHNGDFQVTWSNSPSFGFSILRKSTGDVLFNTIGKTLVFEDQFVEFVSDLPLNYNLYGLGERMTGLRLGNNFSATIYAADSGDPIDRNIYGVQPFYLDTRYYEVDASGDLNLVISNATTANASYISYSHGVYLRNTHAHEVILAPESITWRTLGGSIELYFYSGPTAAEVTSSHVGVIGMPAMQQYFTFGYHQCRWGYSNWSEIEDVVDTFKAFEIPLETVWSDIDYMNQYRNFENDPDRYSYDEAKTFLGKLHASGQHYVPIVDSAIYIPNPDNASDAYAPYNRGNDLDVFMKQASGEEYIGAVWPGFTVFPDWLAKNTQSWWTSELMQWYQNVSFDGIWVDMSEVASFCTGSCGTGRLSENPVHGPGALPGEENSIIYDYPEGFEVTNATEAAAASSSAAAQASRVSATAAPTPASTEAYVRTTPTPGIRNTTYPPYVINNVNGALGGHTLSPDAVHADGTLEYDVHNIFGHSIIQATYNALLSVFPGKRPFIIGRSNFAGSGAFAGHWGGDNQALWQSMTLSIPQALSFSLFGIPMFGVDTCGFSGNTDEELCNRWMQLSAFFPFYRNHNVLSAIPQEPYRWSSVITATKSAMEIRYSLLPYMYTLFQHAHTTGSTVMRALAWEFPHDPSLAGADRQFMLGPSILVTPVLKPQATSVDGVFPGTGKGTVWYDWYTQTAVTASAGQNVTIPAPLGHIPVYVRGGSILPLQEPGYTTSASRANDWSLLVALSPEGTAAGDLYLDDGESLLPEKTKFVDFTATRGSLYVSVRGAFWQAQVLANVTVLGVKSCPTSVTFNGLAQYDVAYDAERRVLSISGLEDMTKGGAWSDDWTLTWA